MKLLNFFRPRTRSFIATLKDYFASISPGKQDATLEKYMYFYNNVHRFLISTGREQIQLHEVKISLMEEMRLWLHNEKKRSIGHVSRHIEHCQACFDYAVLMDYTSHNPIDAIKAKRDKTEEPVSLESAEIKKLLLCNFTSPKRQLVVDLFLFQCFTGLSYIDLWMYEIEKDRHNGHEIQFVTSKHGRGKNHKPYAAEFNQYARHIHKKYNGEFPHITNQGYNKILKKISFALNIDKDLSSHNARKTYATLRYNQGMSFEGIADELGNTPDVLRKSYITKTRERIKRDVERIGTQPLLKFA